MKSLKLGESTCSLASLLGRRDAVHVPIILASSLMGLMPGQEVTFTDETFTTVVGTHTLEDRHGIVDPFLNEWVRPGRIFNVLLDPEMVENMTHHYDLKVKTPEPVEEENSDPFCCIKGQD